MSSYSFSQKPFTPIPPVKGSFPLDHEGSCKELMVAYMRCLLNNKDENTMCRNESKNYLACRMDNQLMAREDWSDLGFAADEVKET